MSKIYTINNGGSPADQIPSIEYIDELKKMIEDYLFDHGTIAGFPSIKTNAEELPVGVTKIPDVLAKNVKTDSQHLFINDGILATMVDKPSKLELEKSLEESKEELKKYMDELYTRIINTPNVINKLRDISTILNEDEVVNGLLNTLSYKLNMDDFNAHTKSSTHMNNNDRKALNVLLKCLIGGFADWNAADGAYNTIKNKPESLPANGGNADTVANHSIKDLINKDDYDIVIGDSRQKYSEDSCDIYAKDGNIDDEAFQSLIKSLINGIILFKRGVYNINTIDSYKELRIINGVNSRLSLITAKDFVRINNSIYNNIGFVDSKIYIESECEINNVTFTNCDIVIGNSTGTNIISCRFNNCRIKIDGYMTNNIIKFNRFIQTKHITYLGGNNIISENI